MAESQLLQINLNTLQLREKIRDYTKSHRNQLRACSSDALRFGIGEIKNRIHELDNLTEKDVIGLAARIKRRKHATSDDMYRLSHAFLQDETNINTFIKIPGAFQVLIKEFTGNDSERRLGSAECLCNLSLGNSHVCEKITLLAGSYLITYLHITEYQLVRMCLWTIANILSTDLKAASNLMKMQLLARLWTLYTDDEVADNLADFREDAAICLQIIALNSDVLLKNDELEYILKHISEKNPTCLASEYHLQFIFQSLFSHHQLITSLSSKQLQYLISYSLSNIFNTKEFKTATEQLKILYSIRVLGNLIACHSGCYSMLLQQISTNWQTNLSFLLNALFSFQNIYLIREVLWFLNNVLKTENEMNIFQSNFLENLKIPEEITLFDIEKNFESMES